MIKTLRESSIHESYGSQESLVNSLRENFHELFLFLPLSDNNVFNCKT